MKLIRNIKPPADFAADPHAARIKNVVTAAIFHGNKVLMLKRSKPPYCGYWEVAGGGLELGETIEKATRREVREETGYFGGRVLETAFAGIYEFIIPGGYHRILYCSGYKVADERVKTTEHEEHAWFPREKLPKPLIPYVREQVADAWKALKSIKPKGNSPK